MRPLQQRSSSIVCLLLISSVSIDVRGSPTCARMADGSPTREHPTCSPSMLQTVISGTSMAVSEDGQTMDSKNEYHVGKTHVSVLGGDDGEETSWEQGSHEDVDPDEYAVDENSGRAETYAGDVHDQSDARSLLSKRSESELAGCKYCSCFGESVVHCGTSTVTSGVLCGYKTVESGAECGWSVTKLCTIGRRRRWSGLKCSTKEVAKSCKVAQKCEITNECNFGSSFSECLDEITSSFSGKDNTFMKYVKNTGCTSTSSCKDRIEKGLDEAVSAMETAAQSELSKLLSDIKGKVGATSDSVTKFGSKAYKEGATVVNGASSKLKDVGEKAKDYVKGLFPPFQKYNIGKLCSSAGTGFWYMKGTDCGAFSSMGKIFSDLTNAERHFKDTQSKFRTCVTKTGLLSFPTPFFDLEIQDYCLPDFFVTGMEYLIGGIIYSGSVISTLVSDIIGVVKSFAENYIGLSQLGRDMLSLRQQRQGANLTVAETSAVSSTETGSQECGSKSNWGMSFFVKYALSAVAPDGSVFDFSFGFGVGFGCESAKLQTPNALLEIGVGFGGTSAPKGVSHAVDIGISWADSFDSFKNTRVKGQAALVITPEVDIEKIVGAPVAVGSPIGFQILPEVDPDGFSFSVAPEVGSDLEQLGAHAQKAAQRAQERASAAGADQERIQLTALQTAVEEIGRPGELKKALANARLPSRQEILRKGAAIDEHKASLVNAATSDNSADAEGPISVKVGSEFAFVFCISPVACS